jgi:hypothetical protein
MLLKLPILVHDEQTAELENLGISVDTESYATDDFYFTRVDIFATYLDNTRVIVDGEEYVCPLPIDKVLKLYKDAISK